MIFGNSGRRCVTAIDTPGGYRPSTINPPSLSLLIRMHPRVWGATSRRGQNDWRASCDAFGSRRRGILQGAKTDHRSIEMQHGRIGNENAPRKRHKLGH